MTYAIPQGIQVSLTGQDGSWYKLSDHNRQPISITYTLIESTDRMANGTLRKFVVARKFVISANWKDLPSIDSNVVDYSSTNSKIGKAGAWIKAFYEGNYGNPVYVKLIFANEASQKAGLPTGSYTDSQHAESSNQVYTAFMTTFTYDVTKRRLGPIVNGLQTGYDYVDLKIEFTEI
jgi:hypothetical protein